MLIDTNILIAALLRPDGVASAALMCALEQHEAFFSSYTLYELQDVIARKFPVHIEKAARLAAYLYQYGSIVEVSETVYGEEDKVRDPDDRLIYRAARHVDAAVLLTGDKDWRLSGIQHPKMMSPAEFLSM